MNGAAAAQRCRAGIVALLLLGFAVSAMATGYLRQSILREPVITALDLRVLDIRAAGGRAHAVDLSSLSVSPRGDRVAANAGYERLPVLDAVVLEDGVPLTRGRWLQDVMDGAGRFLFDGNWVFLSASDGSDPRSNGKAYGAALEVPRWSLRAGDVVQAYQPFFRRPNSLLPAVAAMGTTVAFGVALAVALARSGASTRQRRAVAAAAFAAAAGGLVVEQGAHWNDVIVGYDTQSYMEPAENSFRPPGFSLFARIVGVSASPATYQAYPKEVRVVGDLGDGVLRLVRAGKLLALAALLLFGVSLCVLLPGPVSAALVLGLGNAAAASPVLFGQPIYTALAAGLGSAALATSVMLGWRRANRRGAMLVSAAIAALSASGMIFEYGVLADHLDWVMSETVAHALGLATLAAVLGYAFADRRWMLLAAALGAALVCLVRQAEPYYWLPVLGLLPIAFRRDGPRAWRTSAVVLALFLLSTVVVQLGVGAVSRTAQLGDMHRVAFALLVADPADTALIEDSAAREFFETAMIQRHMLLGPDVVRTRRTAHLFYGLGVDIAWPAALATARRLNAADPETEARALMKKASAAVLAQRYDRYLQFVAASFAEIAAMTRAAYLVPWWLLAAALVVAMATVRGMHAYLAAMMAAAALFAYVIVAVASAPIERLVYPVDVLWFLACMLLAVGAWQRRQSRQGAA